MELKIGDEVTLKDGTPVAVARGLGGEYFLYVVGKGLVYGGVDYDTPADLARYLEAQLGSPVAVRAPCNHAPSNTEKDRPMATNNPQFEIGFSATYIHDYSEFYHVAPLPAEAAVALVKHACPDAVMGHHTKAADLTLGVSTDTDADKNGWLNKFFIIVGFAHNRWLAVCNNDGRFSLYLTE